MTTVTDLAQQLSELEREVQGLDAKYRFMVYSGSDLRIGGASTATGRQLLQIVLTHLIECNNCGNHKSIPRMFEDLCRKNIDRIARELRKSASERITSLKIERVKEDESF